jgi:4-diphosphocytidyl-2C-methyl-D-erythritol kinase
VREVAVGDLAKYEIVIMVPSVAVPTVAFYDRFRAAYPVIARSEDSAMARFLSGTGGEFFELIENDFETCVCEMVPEVAEGLRLARDLFPRSTALTGSGCALFSLALPGEADRVEDLLSSARQQGLGVFRCSLA